MRSNRIARGCAPDDDHPLVETVVRASDAELGAIYTFWQNQPNTNHLKVLAIGIIEREIRERTCLDATVALTPAQQRRVMLFARKAPMTIDAFERFRVVKGAEADTAWIIFTERQLGRARDHAILVDADGAIIEGMDIPRPVERLGEHLPDVDILSLFAEDGSDTLLLAYFRPVLRLPE